MKQTILWLVITSFYVGGYAQANIAQAGTNPGGEPESGSRIYRNSISTRALRDFSQRFKDVAEPAWVIISDGYSARFMIDSVKTRADYNSGGHWVATMRYYGEKKMPPRVRTMVKSIYFDYTIDLVIEMEGRDRTVYEIHLSDETSLVTLRVCDDEMTIVRELEKGGR